VDVLVLGPTVVREGDDALPVSRSLERALLVRLALARGVAVPDERLAADLWGDVELARPESRLRVVVSRLRRSLGWRADAVSRSRAGYRLDADAADLRAAQAAADRLHAAAKADDHAAVLAAATEALAQWRGPAMADLRTFPYAQLEADRLDDWHLELTVARLRAELELGDAAAHVNELATLASQRPLHEPLRCLLALALYRTGRQADALDQLARLRRALADELGVDPGTATAELELRLLRQDPTLLPTPREPAVRTASSAAPELRLPEPSTSFVGRDGELAAVVERLGRPGLVTLVGEPGCGKSRLAAEAVRAIAPAGRRCVVVELARSDRDDAVIVALADAAGVEPGTRDLIAATAAGLDDALLVIDNAEHVVEQVSAAVRELRRVGPALTVLVTSQRPLLLAEETQHRVRPLAPHAASTLFRHRAGVHSWSGPELDADIATICAAVDGLPLGIELAAGLTRTLTVPQLARRVTDRLRLLVGGRRDGSGRHGSLRAALDWSHELLDDREQAVLRRVGVFAGGFTLEAAEHVVPDGKIELGDVAPALAELVDRSLITVRNDTASRRFALLETVRDYALAELRRAGETAATRTRRLAWCFVHVDDLRAVDEFASADTVAAVFAEWPNLREALDQAAGTDVAVDALRLVNALHMPWLARAWFREAQRQYAAFADVPDADPADRARAMSNHAFHTLMVGRLDEAAGLLSRAAELATGLDDDELVATIQYHQGIVEIERCHLVEAIGTLRQGERRARELGDARRASSFADALGTALLFSGDAAGALECYRAATDVDHGDEHNLSRGLSNQAKALLGTGRRADALRAAGESDHYARRLDDRQILPLNDLVRGAVALAEGDLDAAEAHCRTALAYTESGASMAHIDLADVLVGKGELAEARTLLDIVYADTPPGGVPWLAARAVSAALMLAEGDVEAARTLTEEITQMYRASGFGWPRYAERLRAVCERTEPDRSGEEKQWETSYC
jgi:predicted ATPase/DNA-binding SARP family transcriptional activator